MQSLAAELGYINGLLRQADAGKLHLPDGVSPILRTLCSVKVGLDQQSQMLIYLGKEKNMKVVYH
jgi:hypothetical protein